MWSFGGPLDILEVRKFLTRWDWDYVKTVANDDFQGVSS